MNCCCTFYNIARPGWLTVGAFHFISQNTMV